MRIAIKQILNRILNDIKKNWVPITLIFFAWLILTLLFHHFCPVVLFCGFPCPGCGMTRAFFYFFTFHPVKAFEYNPAYPIWLVTLVILAFRRCILGKSLKTKAMNRLIIVTALVTIVVYILRMIYVFPSHEPMVFVHENLLSKLFPIYDRFITENIIK